MNKQRAVTDLIRTFDRLDLDFARDDLGHPELPGLGAALEAEIYRRCTAVAPPIVCRTFEHAMYLRRQDGRLVPRHLNPSHDEIDHGESDEHKACKDRVVHMAQERGLEAFTESSLTAAGVPAQGRRNDVLIRGSATVGYEAQYSDITTAVVTRRVNLGIRDGVTVYFGAPRESRAARSVVDRAPAGTYNHIPALEISRGRPMPIVSGVRRLRRWRCSAEPHLCPQFGTGRSCKATWHSDFGEPLRIEQDDLLYGLAASELVPVRLPLTAIGSWQIVPAESVQDYVSDGGTLLDVPVGPRRAPKRQDVGAAPEENPECRYGWRPADGAAVLVDVVHDGAAWGVPSDLIALQRDWDAADAAVNTLTSTGSDAEGIRAARGHRLDLTGQIVDHPWLSGAMREGKRLQADQALKAAARTGEAQ